MVVWPRGVINLLPPTIPSTHLVGLHCALGAGCHTSCLMWAAGTWCTTPIALQTCLVRKEFVIRTQVKASIVSKHKF